MKSLGKALVSRTAFNPIAWSAYKACGVVSSALGKVYGHAHFVRHTQEEEAQREKNIEPYLKALFPTLVVANGPFRGLRYPSAAATEGSALLPKLLGSYESELHPILMQLARNRYTCVMNIGCGEGYYAVGLALQFPESQIYAFDTDPQARRLCAAMANANGVSSRVKIGDSCNAAVLLALPLGQRSLIFCDCEGYERQLFTAQVAEALSHHDLIIESHDFIDIEISSTLRRVFSSTHTVRSIHSIDDIQKAHTYQYPQLDRYSISERRLILAERRPAIMEWLVITANS